MVSQRYAILGNTGAHTRRSSMLVFRTCLCTYANSLLVRFCSSGGTEGADARAADSSSACSRCCCLIGIAETATVDEGSPSGMLPDGVGDGETPAGLPMDVGSKKSSRFM